ncbi:MAG: DUF1465 family protein [Polymorphobacter sp.]|uniref:DUF1465 family protein n=1 Tax=Polymorphobacter sp. TaxID=1909290 RepID=UPI003A86CD8E
MSFKPGVPLDPLLADAIRIADEARRWMGSEGRALIDALPPPARVQANAEMLATTARLMAIIAWLLHPAQKQGRMPPFNPPHELPLGPGHPLEASAGHDIARASRALAARLQTAPVQAP